MIFEEDQIEMRKAKTGRFYIITGPTFTEVGTLEQFKRLKEVIEKFLASDEAKKNEEESKGRREE